MRTNRKSSSSATTPLLATFVAFAAGAAVFAFAPGALAFGGSADRFPQQGNFVVTNEADLGFTQRLNSPSQTSILIQPALEYFVIPNLSIGGQVLIAYSSESIDTPVGSTSFHTTSFGLAPEVGYDLSLSDTWSFWPKARLGFVDVAPSEGDSSFRLFLGIDAPFLVHPAEHFFFGAGPAFHADLTGDGKATTIGINFIIGGYFGI